MGLAKNLRRFAIPRVIGFSLFRHLAPLANLLQMNAYRLRYLAWYNSWSIGQYLLKTPRALSQDNRILLHQKLLWERQLADTRINYLEFGVATGTTIKWWVENNGHADSRFVGFDTFHGLPEAWAHLPRGHFSTGGAVPAIADDRCRFVEGMFQATLFAELLRLNIAEGCTVIHVDADLYSSTLFVLMTLNPYLKPGDIIVFDEFAYVNDEFRAFLDYQTATGRRLTPLVAVNCGDTIAFEMLAGG